MFNEIHLGPVTIYMYGIMIAAAFLTALELCLIRGKRQGLSEDRIWGIFYCALAGGLLGAKLLYVIVAIKDIIRNPAMLLDIKNGLVVYGGIIGGMLLSLIYLYRKGADVPVYFDLVMPAVAVAQGFGRIGCFCAGCCYGRETDSPFHIMFSNSSFAPNNVPLIPTQLISSAGNLLIGAALMIYASRHPAKGRVTAAYLMLYGTGRFLVEFLRGDMRGSIGPLSVSQAISLGIVATGAVFFVVSGRKSHDSLLKDL